MTKHQNEKMNTKTETKKDGKEFERFDDLLRKVVSVPKKEIEERKKKNKEEPKVKNLRK